MFVRSDLNEAFINLLQWYFQEEKSDGKGTVEDTCAACGSALDINLFPLLTYSYWNVFVSL